MFGHLVALHSSQPHWVSNIENWAREGVNNRHSQTRESDRNEDARIRDTDFLKIIEDKANQIERLIVLTNQPWVGEGTKNIKDHEKIKDSVIESMTEAGIKDVRYMACTHDFEKCCDCRKPKIGLIKKAVYETNFLRSKSIFIGDSITDEICANMANIEYIDYTKGENFTRECLDIFWQKVRTGRS